MEQQGPASETSEPSEPPQPVAKDPSHRFHQKDIGRTAACLQRSGASFRAPVTIDFRNHRFLIQSRDIFYTAAIPCDKQLSHSPMAVPVSRGGKMFKPIILTQCKGNSRATQSSFIQPKLCQYQPDGRPCCKHRWMCTTCPSLRGKEGFN